MQSSETFIDTVEGGCQECSSSGKRDVIRGEVSLVTGLCRADSSLAGAVEASDRCHVEHTETRGCSTGERSLASPGCSVLRTSRYATLGEA